MNGDPSGRAELSLREVFQYLRRTLLSKGMPEPRRFTSDSADHLMIARNVGYQAERAPLIDLELLEASATEALHIAARETEQPCDKYSSPYPGLAPYQESDLPNFFGRDAEVAQVIVRLGERLLKGGPPMLLMGPSGSGKTSVLAAGVIPLLKQHRVLSEVLFTEVPVIYIRPGARPLDTLATCVATLAKSNAGSVVNQLIRDPAALRDIIERSIQNATASDGGGAVVIIVDQFEELFAASRAEINKFVLALASCSATGRAGRRPSTAVVLSLRSNFVDQLAEYPLLVDSVQTGSDLSDRSMKWLPDES